VFIFVLNLINSMTEHHLYPGLLRQTLRSHSMSYFIFTIFLCENCILIRCFFSIFLPLKWVCEKYTGAKNTWVFTITSKYQVESMNGIDSISVLVQHNIS